MKKRRLLFVGDCCAPTGFGTVNEAVLTRLDREYWQIPYVLAINHNGDPHPLGEQLRLYPAQSAPDCDAYGVARFADMVRSVKPDVAFIHQDAWIVAMYLEALKLEHVPIPKIVAWCPPDAENQSSAVRLKGKIRHLLTPSQFGLDALRAGGYDGPGTVVRYGVDMTLFRPIDRTQARHALGCPEVAKDGFFFGRADRNAIRKRYDLTVIAFGQWWHEYDKPDAYLHLHCAPRDIGWDLIQLSKFFNLGTDAHPRVIFTSREMTPNANGMMARDRLPLVFNCWNAHLSTAMGEGGGLVPLESAACGIPQILPRSSALAEWFEGAAEFIEPSQPFVHTGGINTVGRVVSVEDTVQAMEKVFRDEGHRIYLSGKAQQRASGFMWESTVSAVETVLRKVVERG